MIKNSIFKTLLGLIAVFFVGYSALLGIHYIFANIIEGLDDEIKNEQARYKIGEYILDEINTIETNYYQMSTLYRKDAAQLIKDEIYEEIEHIYYALDVLKSGGYVYKYIKLNMAEAIETREKIEFYPRENVHVSYENLDLKPKLFVLEDKVDELVELIGLRNNMLREDITTKEKRAIRVKIAIFLKQIPPQFLRMKENASRLLYQSKQNVLKLEANIENEKKKYLELELVVSLVVMAFVLLFGYFVSLQIRRKNTELEELTEKAKELANDAFQANEAKSQFLANMSHEIRTPLNAIIGFSDILASSNLGSKEKDKANIISRSAKALLNIINDILDLAKVESGKLEIVNEEFKTEILFEQIVELFSINAREKNIRFFYDADAKIPSYLLGDSTRLKQVLSNLISNAIKFTPNDSKVHFKISVLSQTNSEVKLRFLVQDHGIGISKENIKKIFDPFSQADGSISRKFGGTGLGLSISLQIIELMGSKIELESTEGEGSTFFFDINFKKVEDLEEPSKHLGLNFGLCAVEKDEEKLRENLENYLIQIGDVYTYQDIIGLEKLDLVFCTDIVLNLQRLTNVKEKFPACKLIYVGEESLDAINSKSNGIVDYKIDVPIYGSKVFNIIANECKINKKEYDLDNHEIFLFEGKVLVAEDNINNQELIKILLEKLGLTCDLADNGQEAVEKFKENSYDLIFMDINMPILDGLGAMKKIKKINKDVTIVALTANTLKGDKEMYLREGMNDFLSKPIMMSELMEILQKYVEYQTTCDVTFDEAKEEEESLAQEADEKEIIYDKNVALHRLMLDESILDMLLENFFMTLESDVEALQNALESDNKEEIYQMAHRLKGSCANLAMDDLAAILLDLEQRAKKAEDTSFDLEALKIKFQAIKDSL